MSPSAHVKSDQALENLKRALNEFAVHARNSLRAAEQEIQRVEQWLHERQTHWRIEVQRRQEEARQAEAALSLCLASGYRDPKTGACYVPPCVTERQAVSRTRAQLQKAESELCNVENWIRMVSQSAAAYRSQSQRLQRTLSTNLPKAGSVLESKSAELRSYLSGTLVAGSHVTPMSTKLSSPSRSTTGPAPSARNWLDTGIQPVTLDQIDLSDSSVTGTSDFRKVSAQGMIEGFRKLEKVVIPAVAQGHEGEYFSQLDKARGLDYAHGYRRIYDAFYGQEAIRLEKLGNSYQVVNGYHRLFIAHQLGIKAVPARVIARRT